MRPRTLAAAVVAVTAIGLIPASAAHAALLPYQDPTLPVATRVNDLLARMSLDEKLGQMTQAERGAVTNAQITQFRLGSLLSGGGSAPSPNNATSWANMYDGFQNAALATPLGIPLIYGVDAVHGHNNVNGRDHLPAQHRRSAPPATRRWSRTSAARWPRRSPAPASTGTSPRACAWPATTAGAAPTSRSARRRTCRPDGDIITGLQGSTLNGPASVLATAKHYVGDGGTTNGTDQGNTQLTEAELRAIHLPPFQAAVRRNVGSVMISYSSWNGVKMHGNQYLITTVLKGELGFSGFVVSDWNGIDQIDGAAGFTATEVRTAINAGIDMVMVPNDWQNFITPAAHRGAGRPGHDGPHRRREPADPDQEVRAGPLRAAADRPHLHLHRGQRRAPGAGPAGRAEVAGAAEERRQHPAAGHGQQPDLRGRQERRQHRLPERRLDDLLAGRQRQRHAGNHDPAGHPQHGRAVHDGHLQRHRGGHRQHLPGRDRGRGETPYAEGAGDRPGGMGLDTTDLNTITTLRNAGVPVIVVLVSGRPLDIASQLPNWNALLAAWLPGTEGQGVADVLFGVVAPTGKLPMTWMSSASQQPINDGDGKAPLFAYGFGLGLRRPRPASAYARSRRRASHAQSGHADRVHNRHRRRAERGLHRARRLARLRPRLRRRRRRRRSGPGSPPARPSAARSSTGWTAPPARSSPACR